MKWSQIQIDMDFEMQQVWAACRKGCRYGAVKGYGRFGRQRAAQTTHTTLLGDKAMTRWIRTHREWKHMLRTAAALEALKIEWQHFSVRDGHCRTIFLYTYGVARDWKSLDT